MQKNSQAAEHLCCVRVPMQKNTTITKLDMSKNEQVTDEGWKAFAAGLAVRGLCLCVFCLSSASPTPSAPLCVPSLPLTLLLKSHFCGVGAAGEHVAPGAGFEWQPD